MRKAGLPYSPETTLSGSPTLDDAWWDALQAECRGAFAEIERMLRPKPYPILPDPVLWRGVKLTFLPERLDFGTLFLADGMDRRPRRYSKSLLLASEPGSPPVRVRRVDIFPAGSVFKLSRREPTVSVLRAGGAEMALDVDIAVDSSNRAIVKDGACTAFVVADVERSFSRTPVEWVCERAVLGCLVQANILETRRALEVEAQPFVPPSLREVFDATAVVSFVDGEGEMDAVDIPESFRTIEMAFRAKLPANAHKLLNPPPSVLQLRNGIESNDAELNAYQKRLDFGLQLEIHQMFHDINAYDLCLAKVIHRKDLTAHDPDRNCFVEFLVPGMVERRPAPILFDIVRLRLSCSESQPTDFYGRILRRERQSLTLRLPPQCAQFLENGKTRYHIRFRPGYHAMRLEKMRKVVRQIRKETFRRILDQDSWKYAADRSPVFCSDATGELNSEQLRVVEKIVAPLTKMEPFLLVDGPPGTGKTRTLTAAIGELLARDLSARILAVAPSNSAADVFCWRLAALFQTFAQRPKMLRLNSYTRPTAECRQNIMQYTHVDTVTGYFSLPSIDAIAEQNVVVVTCSVTDDIRRFGIPATHFQYLVVDEAAQALEAETLMPLTLVTSKSRVVLCGDAMQLNPSVRSQTAKQKLRLHVSMFDRLLQQRSANYPNSSYTVRLKKNYRSHARLLELPSHLFYRDSLEAWADQKETATLMQWARLPVQRPYCFCAIESIEEIPDERSTGIHNVEEAREITQLTSELVASGLCGVRDIGVIAPYRKQVELIRHCMRAFAEKSRAEPPLPDLSGVNVGTVMDFQGQEQRVILVSTTLSTEATLLNEKEFSTGLTGNPRAFNVATTRATSLLLVVGNPQILWRDPHWAEYLKQCDEAGAWMGIGRGNGASQRLPVLERDEAAEVDTDKLIDEACRSFSALLNGEWRSTETQWRTE